VELYIHPEYFFMAWRLVKHRDFTFTITFMFTFKGIISAVERVELVSDRMSNMSLRGR